MRLEKYDSGLTKIVCSPKFVFHHANERVYAIIEIRRKAVRARTKELKEWGLNPRRDDALPYLHRMAEDSLQALLKLRRAALRNMRTNHALRISIQQYALLRAIS